MGILCACLCLSISLHVLVICFLPFCL
jgi:protein DEK